MSLNPTHGNDVKDKQGSSDADAVTGEAPGGDEKGACQDEAEVKDASAEGCDSLLPSQQKGVVGDETVGAESHPDTKSISARDLQQKLVDIGSEDLSVLLPEEIVLKLFELMTPIDIVAASQTCRLWRILGENNKLWHEKCKEAGLVYSLKSVDLIMIQCQNKASNILHSPWKFNFLKLFKIEKNLRHGVPQVLTIENSHNVVLLLKAFNDRIVCAKVTPTLYVFSALSGDLLHELVGHTDHVITGNVQMDDQFIVSGSSDTSVKVWDVDTGSCVHTMLGHTASVLCLEMQGNVAVSGSRDRTLRMWDVREGRCLRTLSGHTDSLHHVQFDGNVVVSSSYDRTIKIWDPETGECRRTISSSTYSLKFNGVDVVMRDYNGSIKVWDVTNGVCRHTLVGNADSRGVDMELQGDTLVCGGGDFTTAKIWCLSTGACLHTLAGAQKHSRHITGIQHIGKLVVTSSMDGTVKLWDLTTGQFIKDLLVLESGRRVEKMKIEDAKIVCVVRSNEGSKLLSKLLVLNFDNNEEN